MCSVSAVHDYFGQRPSVPWTPDTFRDYQEIVRRLDALDRKLGEPACDDPAKAAWMREVEARLKALEARPAPEASL
jgi:hypothetical protein